MPKDASHNEIWSRLLAGNRDVLPDLYDKYYLDLMNYGLKVTGDRPMVNDCITQVLLRLWDKRGSLPEVSSPRSYLLTCLRHQIYASLKSEQKRLIHSRAIQRMLDGEEPSYEEYLIGLQTNLLLREKLEKALNLLTDREKELLQLKFGEDLDYDEISARCGITKRTAYNIIHTSLKTLRMKVVTQPANGLVPDAKLLGLVPDANLLGLVALLKK
jgi:RNA polymerase sigma factor (sigma-70 family)